MIITKQEAIKQGLTRYFTGKPCSKGHIAERYTCKSTCVTCDSLAGAKYRRTPQGKKKGHLNVSRRRARKKNAIGNFTEANIKEKFYDQFGKCAICKREFSEQLKYTIDHIIPLSKQGTNWPSNIQLLCGSCNSKKSNKNMEEWLLYKSAT